MGGNVTRYTYDAAGRLTGETDPLGFTTIYTYNQVGNLVARRDKDGTVTTFAYDGENRLTGETDALGRTTTYVYDAAGRQIEVRRSCDGCPGGPMVARTEYDSAGRVVRAIDPRGGVTQYIYDQVGRVALRIMPNGGTFASTYDQAGRSIQEVDAVGGVTTHTYDSLGRLLTTRDPLGHLTTNRYDPAGNLVAVTDAHGNTASYAYDTNNRQIATTDVNGATTRTEYDATGRVLREIDALGNATVYGYDANGNQTSVTDPLGRTRHSEYDARNQLIKTTSPAGNVTTYSYDAQGRQTEVRDPLGQRAATVYDAAGRAVAVTDALGRTTTITYDALDHVTMRIDVLKRTTRYTYDAAGQLLSMSAPNGVTQRYTYDVMGNVLMEQDGGDYTVRYRYDRMNRVVAKLDGPIEINLPLIVGGSAGVTPPAPGPATPVRRQRVWSYGYDLAGNQTSISTPAGQRIQMLYDELNRPIEKRHNGTPFATYSYDANGNRTGIVDAHGTTAYSYDPLNRLTASIDPAGRTVRYGYDTVGQRIQLSYPDGASARYAYNLDGALREITAPDGTTTRYELDALNRPTRVVQGNGVTVQYRYDAAGNQLEISQRDAAGALFARHQYTVDAANRRIKQVAQLPQETVTTDYGYDALDRLILSTASDGSETRYTFDNAGNRVAESGVRVKGVVAPEAYRISYRYGPANELLRAEDSVLGVTTYSYDADGLRTGSESQRERARYRYDAEGRMVEARVEDRVGQQWLLRDAAFQRYIYDGDGRRVLTETYVAASNTLRGHQEHRYDDVNSWDVLQSYDSAGGSNGERYLYDQPFHKLAYGSGPMSYFQNDGLGSVLGATNAQGKLASPGGLMRYGDYGQLLGPTAALPTVDSYTGYELDRYTGLNYARNRYYDAGTGTFVTPDPFPANREDMGDLHRYLYVQGRPLDATDPLGLYSLDCGYATCTFYFSRSETEEAYRILHSGPVSFAAELICAVVAGWVDWLIEEGRHKPEHQYKPGHRKPPILRLPPGHVVVAAVGAVACHISFKMLVERMEECHNDNKCFGVRWTRNLPVGPFVFWPIAHGGKFCIRDEPTRHDPPDTGVGGTTLQPPVRRVLRYGSRGADVEALQLRLNTHGARPSLSVDGNFGPRTRQAVINFQRARGLKVDGIVGPQTWAAFERPGRGQTPGQRRPPGTRMLAI
jgi:RHS repeat-associated protein